MQKAIFYFEITFSSSRKDAVTFALILKSVCSGTYAQHKAEIF
jgi:hypothetical protein